MFVYICDFFVDEVLGGCELNDNELIIELQKRGNIVKKYKSNFVTRQIVEENKNACFIISNFIYLDAHLINLFYDKKYIIYEHDHKYISTRNPALYKDFLCPKNLIVNYEFYKNSTAVLCQSNLHKQIMQNNLQLSNIISVGGNLWSIEDLNYMKIISLNKKREICSILDSFTEHKNTNGSIEYCKKNNISYELIKSSNYQQFLQILGSNKQLCFLPKTPETLSRIVVEARMMGVSVISNKLVGATSEQWFNMSGEPLINYMLQKRTEITTLIEKI